jgi:hypothetical protein
MEQGEKGGGEKGGKGHRKSGNLVIWWNGQITYFTCFA